MDYYQLTRVKLIDSPSSQIFTFFFLCKLLFNFFLISLDFVDSPWNIRNSTNPLKSFLIGKNKLMFFLFSAVFPLTNLIIITRWKTSELVWCNVRLRFSSNGHLTTSTFSSKFEFQRSIKLSTRMFGPLLWHTYTSCRSLWLSTKAILCVEILLIFLWAHQL